MRWMLTALVVTVLSVPAGARGQLLCVDHDIVASTLLETYSEKPVSMGLASNGWMIEVFVSPAGTFTIIATNPAGEACFVTAGKNWEGSLPVPPGDRT